MAKRFHARAKKHFPRFAGPKKAVTALFQMRASAVPARVSLYLRVSLRKRRGENREGSSRPFLSSAPAFLPGQQGDGSERPTKWEMIHKFYDIYFGRYLPDEGNPRLLLL